MGNTPLHCQANCCDSRELNNDDNNPLGNEALKDSRINGRKKGPVFNANEIVATDGKLCQ